MIKGINIVLNSGASGLAISLLLSSSVVKVQNAPAPQQNGTEVSCPILG
jgi:hypothetical protein